MEQFPRDSQCAGEIGRTDEQEIDTVDTDDGVDLIDGFWRLDLDCQPTLGVRPGDVGGARATRPYGYI